jgi:hypothetical protein
MEWKKLGKSLERSLQRSFESRGGEGGHYRMKAIQEGAI